MGGRDEKIFLYRLRCDDRRAGLRMRTNLPDAAADRDLETIKVGAAAIANVHPGSPLTPVTTGPLLDTVMRVESVFPGLNRHGSAFHVGGGILLSAAHNFHKRDGVRADCTEARVLHEGAWHELSQWATFPQFTEQAKTNWAYDFAVCVAPTLRRLGARLDIADGRSGAANRIGEVAGFPKRNGYDGESLYKARGTYSITDDKDFFLHKASTLDGSSGGPLLNSNGAAIGIHTVGYTRNRATTLYNKLIALVNDAVKSGAIADQ